MKAFFLVVGRIWFDQGQIEMKGGGGGGGRQREDDQRKLVNNLIRIS